MKRSRRDEYVRIVKYPRVITPCKRSAWGNLRSGRQVGGLGGGVFRRWESLYDAACYFNMAYHQIHKAIVCGLYVNGEYLLNYI